MIKVNLPQNKRNETFDILQCFHFSIRISSKRLMMDVHRRSVLIFLWICLKITQQDYGSMILSLLVTGTVSLSCWYKAGFLFKILGFFYHTRRES